MEHEFNRAQKDTNLGSRETTGRHTIRQIDIVAFADILDSIKMITINDIPEEVATAVTGKSLVLFLLLLIRVVLSSGPGGLLVLLWPFVLLLV